MILIIRDSNKIKMGTRPRNKGKSQMILFTGKGGKIIASFMLQGGRMDTSLPIELIFIQFSLIIEINN